SAGQLHAPELPALDVWGTVKPSQGFVHEGEIGVEKVEDTAILPDYGLEEKLGFRAHGISEGVVESGISLRIGVGLFEQAQIKPLSSEVLRQCPGPRIAQHTPSLNLYLFAQAVAGG